MKKIENVDLVLLYKVGFFFIEFWCVLFILFIFVGFSEILFCTDLLLLGNDIQGCTLCIQYRVPQSLGVVLHRSWKMGAKREVASNPQNYLLYFKDEKKSIEALENNYNLKMKEEEIPSVNENRKAISRQVVNVS